MVVTYEAFIPRFDKQVKTADGVMVRCPAHPDGRPSLHASRSRDGGIILNCFAGCQTRDIVAALGLEMKDLFAKEPTRSFRPPPPVVKASVETETKVKPVIEKVYSYTDGLGRELYQAIRLKPKDFRQRHRVGDKWVWDMAGVERVLYRLPEVLAATTVFIVEGEKDADNLAALGFCATCNVGGAGKWMDGYTESLKGKNIVLCGDNDDPGRKHIELVFESIASRAATVRIVKLPSIFKDASDLIEARGDKAHETLVALQEAAVPHVGGLRMPIYSMAEIEARYHKSVTESKSQSLDLSEWLPSLRRIRPLTPGTMMLIAGDTGAGKTLLLQNIGLMAARKNKTLMFELELSDADLFERFMAHRNKCECVEVEEEYRTNGCLGSASMMTMFPNLFISPEAKMTVEQLEAIVLRAELKMGGKPLVVLIDYVQLLQGDGKSRYEKTSNVAEALKVMAKSTQTIVVVASQVDRASGKDREIGLHSGKDSGSLENSAGLVIGAWRDAKDQTLLHLQILKSTKGGAGYHVLCNIDGAKATITERIGKCTD